MKIGLVYDTKREKAMVEVVGWLKDALSISDHELEIGKPPEMSGKDFDAYILGSSIYGGKAESGLMSYIRGNKKTLMSRPVATFIVCKERLHPEEHMKQIFDILPISPVAQMYIEGYILFRRNFARQVSKADEFAREVLGALE